MRGPVRALGNLASLLQLLGRHAEAEPVLREALDGARPTLGDAHPDTQTTRNGRIDLDRKRHALEPGAGHDARVAELEARRPR